MEQAGALNIRELTRNGMGTPVLMVMMLSMMVLPLPTIMLDMLFTFNISLAMVVILAGIYSRKPLDFAAFPTVLLIATLLRLGLNVASTRVVLLNGHTGTDAAGQVIKAFGEFVVGGNYTVGLVVFIILVIINFVVVTKGAGRVSEVSARFTLDAMPGKQMAIDADLNAGIINQDEARERREEIMREADFYGAMDGASKFVRGDAIAGILILIINIVGGLSIGIIQHDMAFSDAMRNYTLLTIGDGLVAQIPSLVLSSAAAIMVTRISSAQDMGSQILHQLFADPRSLAVTSAVLGAIGLIPGMPNFAFLLLATIGGSSAWYMMQRQRVPEIVVQPKEEAPAPESVDLGWDDVVPVDPIGLEVGYRLIPLVDKTQGGQLMGRIKGIRRKLTQELGFLISPVHIRDNLDLPPSTYRISLMGVPVGETEVHPERELAINPGQVFGELAGIRTVDPAFGLKAIWIEADQREQAQTLGYTVVDASTVIATHLSQVIQTHAHELLGREDVQQLLDNLAKSSPKLVESLVPEALPLGVIVKVLQNLLEENIPIRDIRSIAETLADYAPSSHDPDMLTNVVRAAISRSIVQQINGMEPELPIITLDPALEQILQDSIQMPGGGGFEPGLAERLLRSLSEAVQQQETAGQVAVLVVSAPIRTLLARFARGKIPSLHVLSFNEIPDNRQIRIVATISNNGQINQ
ncbi:MAG: flagellar biosynthesis protein FlhA [Gammaproteobacteria bacterium]|nr:flagellar biosynthesis protein FlhA [Gammaproteobacteria bacterium]MDH5594176.1 flagellar biosynthesis protein FlhA [Gammaproteobacteria bacterium]MDH5614137.1 flagellar biosynthesis protein FlhA [Gammaproteobacteria bacterium]